MSVKRYRRVLDGRFKIGRGNFLIYHIKSPVQGTVSDNKAPHQIRLHGRWSLTKNYDLKLTLNKWRRQIPGDELTLKGEIIKVDAHSLLFAVTTRIKGRLSTNILKLRGVWFVDKHNRLAFNIEKENSRYDTLIFDGIWEVDSNHRLLYHYEKSYPRYRRTVRRSLRFKGYWDITEENRLSYRLDLKGASFFNFQSGIGIIDRSSIKYEIGIGISKRKRPVKKVITLYGRWRVKKGLGILFELEYERGKVGNIYLGIFLGLSKKYKIKFVSRGMSGKRIYREFTLAKRFSSSNGEAFIRLFKSYNEIGAYGGIGIRW